jgi:hypothetical protein
VIGGAADDSAALAEAQSTVVEIVRFADLRLRQLRGFAWPYQNRPFPVLGRSLLCAGMTLVSATPE